MNEKEALQQMVLALAVPICEFKVSGIYFLMLEGEIVYIGQTTVIAMRIQSHLGERIKEFDAYTFFPMANKADRVKEEKRLIEIFKPKYNFLTLKDLGFISWQEQNAKYKFNWCELYEICRKHKIKHYGEHLIDGIAFAKAMQIEDREPVTIS